MEITQINDMTRIDDGNVHHGSVNNAIADDGNAQMSYLSKMAAVDIEFNDLMYSVPEFIGKGNYL